MARNNRLLKFLFIVFLLLCGVVIWLLLDEPEVTPQEVRENIPISEMIEDGAG